MDTLFLYNTKTLKEKFNTKVFAGDNNITKIAVQIPDNIGGYPKRECEFNLRAIIPEGNLSYMINPSQPYFYITNDITEKAQTVKLMMIITHEGNVIGRTNTVDLVVNEPAEAPDPPLTPREHFDDKIEEQRAKIAEQAETISEQASQIEQDTETINGLNTQVSDLTTENEQLETQHTADQNTIQYLIENPPEAKLQPKSVQPTSQMQVVEPDEGYQGLSTVTVGAVTPPRLQSKQVVPSELTTFVTADDGYDGLSSVTVDNVDAVQLGFEKEYYAKGHTFLGLDGTYNPFPEHSYGGIYYTELGEGGYPKKILIKDMLRSASTIPQFFDTSNDAKRELREVVFENCPGFLTLPPNIFNGFNYLTKVTLPDSLTSIGTSAFYNCASLTELTLPDSLTSVSGNAFNGCSSLMELTLPDSLTSIGTGAFGGCASLTELTLPDSLTSIGGNVFYNCTSLTELTLAQGFNCNGLNVSSSTRFTAETIVACLEALADRTGQTAYTITFGSTNLNKLTAEQRAIATNKNWNLA